MPDISDYTTVFRAKLNPDVHRRVAKRNRPPVSCILCRTRKQKCDRRQPCGACTARGETDSCRYSAASTSSLSSSATAAAAAAAAAAASAASAASASNSSPATTSRQEAQLRLQRLEEMVHGLMAGGIREPVPSDSPTSSLLRSHHLAAATAVPPPSSSGGVGGYEAESSEGGRRSQPSTTTTTTPPPSSTTGGAVVAPQLAGTPFIGATHWSAVLQSIRDIQTFLEAETSSSSSSPPSATAPTTSTTATNKDDHGTSSTTALPLPPLLTADDPDPIFVQPDGLTMAETLRVLPARAECDRLLRFYFQTRAAPIPFLHGPQFQRAYEAFWADPPATSFLWVSMLCSVLCMGAALAAAKAGPESGVDGRPGASPRVARLRALAVRCLVAGEYLKGRPGCVEATMLYAMTRLAQSKDADTGLWSTFSVAVRLAQRMGYHRDPKHFGANMTPFEGEMRKRTWYMVEVFDLLYSFQFGMPTVIHDEDTDTGRPTNLLDRDFDEDCTELPPERPFTDDTPVLYFCVKSAKIRLMRKISRHALGPKATDRDKTLALTVELKSAQDIIPPSLRPRPLRSTPFSDAPPQILQRLTLELGYLKTICVLHRVYLTYQPANPAFEPFRRECRAAALRILDLHAEYIGETHPGGRLAEDRHSMSSLMLHDFLLAAMVLCLDVMESADLGPDEKATEVEALRKAHAIWAERKRTSRDAAHATWILGAILRKVTSAAAEEPSPGVAGTKPATTQQQQQQQQQQQLRPGDFGDNGVLRDAAATTRRTEAPLWGYDWMDTGPLDNFLSNPNTIDWNDLDGLLSDRARHINPDEENVWSAELMFEG